MHTITSLIAKLKEDFPELYFKPGETFHWNAPSSTVYYQVDSLDTSSLLHELAHAILNHQSFTRDVQLIEYEQAAWHHASEILAPRYGITITAQQIEDSLDTYRDWLHARSSCPQCNATGLQIKNQLYSCLACRTQWKANDARLCGLRRTIIAP